MKSLLHLVLPIFRFYSEGFRNMSSWGRKAWLIVIIKLFIIFVLLKVFFFKDFLGRKYTDDEQKSEYVRNQILNTPDRND
jgi:hypothetical protein